MALVKKAVIDAPADKVWATITEPEHINKWFSGAGCEIDELRPGGVMTFRFRGGGSVYGRIVEVEPQRVFAYQITNEFSGEKSQGKNAIDVRFTLTADGDRTHLRLEESNSHQDKIKAVAESL